MKQIKNFRMFEVQNSLGGGANHHRHTGIKILGRQRVASTSDRLLHRREFCGDLPSFYIIFKKPFGMQNSKGPKKMVVSELKVRYRPPSTPVQLSTERESYDFLLSIWDKQLLSVQEQVYAVFLNRQSEVLCWRCMNTGTNTSSQVDIKLLFSIALACMAQSIIIAHNHPSGALIPSKNDVKVTLDIHDVCLLLGITLKDHLIVTQRSYNSIIDYIGL